jgi:uncharacterized tannase-like protein DUF6351
MAPFVSSRHHNSRALRRFVAAFLLLVTAFGPTLTRAADPLQIRVLGTRADLVSGGDALVEMLPPTGSDPTTLTTTLGATDVTSSFALRPNGRFMGVVTGLVDGANVLTATFPNSTGAKITITNHPIGGPIISGAQIQPWLCTTATNGLGTATDAQCNAPTKYEFFYKSTDGTKSGLQAYNTASPPTDVANTTTDKGVTVPYIVRREMGTANRGIYAIAVLVNPAESATAWTPPAAWNGKVYYPFGASCGTIHSQSSPTGVLDDTRLSKGWLVADSSLNVLGNNCNTITSAESTIMLRERVVERYGEVRYTIGSGCSGGSIGQQMVSNAYPGLVDGIQPTCSFADTWSTGIEVVDCHLLVHYFNETSPQLWAVPAQRMAVDGTMSPSSCIAWEALFAPVIDPHQGCGLPAGSDYDETTNPTGCRGDLADYMVSIVGKRPPELWTTPAEQAAGGFANLAVDNVGVQYGLTALRSGLITPEQFVDMNQKIGAFDIDFNFTAARREADPGSLKTLYRSGQINDGSQLDQVAIVDLRGSSNHEIHADYHTYVMRERLDNANGHHDNHIVWSNPLSLAGDPGATSASWQLLDRWLAAVEADHSNLSREEKIRRNKPAAAVDACWFAGLEVTDRSVCRAAIPYFASPRIAAGGPTTHDIGKCQLKPLDPADYNVTFSADQWTRLGSAFPTGVCDWSKPGVDKVPSIPWMTFADGPGELGHPLGDAPVSEAV